MSTVPRFSLIDPIELWDDLTLMAANIWCEAEGEPEAGKLAVGWVVMNRSQERNQTVHNVIFAPLQFSWLNQDYRPRAEARLSVADGSNLEACWKAAAGALWKLEPDPTLGANHYLNTVLTKKIRGGTLPAWFKEDKVTVVLGRHTFLRL